MSTSARPFTPARFTWSAFLRRTAPVVAAALVGGATLFAAAPASAQTTPKIAVIDLRRAMAETEQGLRVKALLSKLFESRQVEIEAKTRQIQADKEALEKEVQAGKTPKETLQKKYEKLLQLDAELQKLQLEAQREMQRKEQEMTTPILQGILEAVKRIAAQDGFEMVLEKSAVPFFRGDLELTDRAIQMYNGGAGKVPPGPAKPGTPPAPSPTPGPAKPPAPTPAPAPAPKK
jgi:outer membrane protein